MVAPELLIVAGVAVPFVVTADTGEVTEQLPAPRAKNKDGYLTKNELPMPLQQMFAKADTNGDGKLDKEEIEQLLEIMRKRLGRDGKGLPGKPDFE